MEKHQLENAVSNLLDVVDTMLDLEIRKSNIPDGDILETCKEVVNSIKHNLNTI